VKELIIRKKNTRLFKVFLCKCIKLKCPKENSVEEEELI